MVTAHGQRKVSLLTAGLCTETLWKRYWNLIKDERDRRRRNTNSVVK